MAIDFVYNSSAVANNIEFFRSEKQAFVKDLAELADNSELKKLMAHYMKVGLGSGFRITPDIEQSDHFIDFNTLNNEIRFFTKGFSESERFREVNLSEWVDIALGSDGSVESIRSLKRSIQESLTDYAITVSQFAKRLANSGEQVTGESVDNFLK